MAKGAKSRRAPGSFQGRVTFAMMRGSPSVFENRGDGIAPVFAVCGLIGFETEPAGRKDVGCAVLYEKCLFRYHSAVPNHVPEYFRVRFGTAYPVGKICFVEVGIQRFSSRKLRGTGPVHYERVGVAQQVCAAVISQPRYVVQFVLADAGNKGEPCRLHLREGQFPARKFLHRCHEAGNIGFPVFNLKKRPALQVGVEIFFHVGYSERFERRNGFPYVEVGNDTAKIENLSCFSSG